jgi:hypothetical protein
MITIKSTKSKITDDRLDRTLEAAYNEFLEVDHQRFPQTILVDVKAQSPLRIKVTYTKVTSGEQQTMPFSVPEKYDRK